MYANVYVYTAVYTRRDVYVRARSRKSFNIYAHLSLERQTRLLRGRRRVGTQITYNNRVRESIDITYKHAITTRCGLLLYRGQSVAHSHSRTTGWPAIRRNILVNSRLTKRLRWRVPAYTVFTSVRLWRALLFVILYARLLRFSPVWVCKRALAVRKTIGNRKTAGRKNLCQKRVSISYIRT